MNNCRLEFIIFGGNNAVRDFALKMLILFVFCFYGFLR